MLSGSVGPEGWVDVRVSWTAKQVETSSLAVCLSLLPPPLSRSAFSHDDVMQLH